MAFRYACDAWALVWEAFYFWVTYQLWTRYDSLSWPAFLAVWYVSAAFSFFGATITHNTIHVPMFKQEHTVLNCLHQIALSCTYGWPVSMLIPGHNLSHHKFTNSPKDTMRSHRMRFKHHFLNVILFPVVTVMAIAKYDNMYMADQRKKNTPIWQQYKIEAGIFYPLQVALAYVNWRKYLVVVMVPQLLAKYQIVGMNTLQHDGCPTPEEDKYNHSRNFTGFWINFFTFNNGYHTIHHQQPGLHWSKIPEKHKQLIAPFNHPNLNQTSLPGYIYNICVSPGKRTSYDGSEYKLPPQVPDQPWYDGTSETYSVTD